MALRQCPATPAWQRRTLLSRPSTPDSPRHVSQTPTVQPGVTEAHSGGCSVLVRGGGCSVTLWSGGPSVVLERQLPLKSLHKKSLKYQRCHELCWRGWSTTLLLVGACGLLGTTPGPGSPLRWHAALSTGTAGPGGDCLPLRRGEGAPRGRGAGQWAPQVAEEVAGGFTEQALAAAPGPGLPPHWRLHT